MEWGIFPTNGGFMALLPWLSSPLQETIPWCAQLHVAHNLYTLKCKLLVFLSSFILIIALNSANIHFISIQCQNSGSLEKWHEESERKTAVKDFDLEDDKFKAENDLALRASPFCWKPETKKYVVASHFVGVRLG